MNTKEMVLIRYTDKPLKMHDDAKELGKYWPWLKEHIAYEIEYGYINGHRVGFYLEPEDAIMFRLRFGL